MSEIKRYTLDIRGGCASLCEKGSICKYADVVPLIQRKKELELEAEQLRARNKELEAELIQLRKQLPTSVKNLSTRFSA